VLGETLGGRQPALAAALEANAPKFRFSRRVRRERASKFREPNRKKIAQAMTAASGATGKMAADFTYLRQFIDHDLTFDKSPLIEAADMFCCAHCASEADVAGLPDRA
jgi:hypothetical protein